MISYHQYTGVSNSDSTDASLREQDRIGSILSSTGDSCFYEKTAVATNYQIVNTNKLVEVLDPSDKISHSFEELKLLFERVKAVFKAHILLLDMALDFLYSKPIIKFIFIRPLFYRKCFMSLKTFQNLRFK